MGAGGLTPAYGAEPEGAGLRPPPASPRDVAFYVYGFARGDEQKARAILEALVAMTGNGSVRAVAGRTGFAEATLRWWVGSVREGMVRAAGVVGR